PAAHVPFRLETERLWIPDERRGQALFDDAGRPNSGGRREIALAKRADRRSERDKLAVEALNAHFHGLPAGKQERPGQARDGVQTAVEIELGAAFAVIDAESEDAVVARSLEAALLKFLQQLLLVFRRPVVERPEIALVRAVAGIDGVAAVERYAVAARLHFLEAPRQLRLPDANAVDPVRGQVNVGVQVANLGEERVRPVS